MLHTDINADSICVWPREDHTEDLNQLQAYYIRSFTGSISFLQYQLTVVAIL